jgi:hypothetical protein
MVAEKHGVVNTCTGLIMVTMGYAPHDRITWHLVCYCIAGHGMGFKPAAIFLHLHSLIVVHQ